MKEHKQALDREMFHQPESDPQGSYTGVPERPLEQPVQDADDL